ncbi:hypothetical protein TSAR_013187 [Trichomalopsis sarcophagae]|uniref:Uncharacterized protein n=1 Tax=Trichomalopsis sarcophagae TaxID=543379 RepID=A0A232ERW1_9HYME|nr:hypothetical protein TSAR_013187 [Trichomalopsis sarcophagae]
MTVVRVAICLSHGCTPLALLRIEDVMDNPSVKMMIRMLALKKVYHPSIEMKDLIIINDYFSLRSYYNDCLEEIERLISTRFIRTCTFIELLTKSHKNNYQAQLEQESMIDEAFYGTLAYLLIRNLTGLKKITLDLKSGSKVTFFSPA